MFLRISWGALKPGTWEEYEATHQRVVPGVGEVEGLRGRIVARHVDRMFLEVTGDHPPRARASHRHLLAAVRITRRTLAAAQLASLAGEFPGEVRLQLGNHRGQRPALVALHRLQAVQEADAVAR